VRPFLIPEAFSLTSERALGVTDYIGKGGYSMNSFWKHAMKLLLEDKQMKKMYTDLEKMGKELQKVVKESEELKKKWK
jgi:hypothetical protein